MKNDYSSMRVKDAMEKISKNEIYLPAIQRKFVWDTERIEKLFDSIMRGYPIGTFLFWDVLVEEAKDEYTFYKFIQDYHERDRAWNEVAPKPDLKVKFIGVLDGQQRLNSMYVALQGSYAYKRKHGKWQDDTAFPKRLLYINLFYKPVEEDENGIAYKFAFLTTEQAQVVDDDQYWFLVKTVLSWQELGSGYTDVINKACEKHPSYRETFVTRCAPLLTLLWQRLCSDDAINYFSIRDQKLDSIVDIFVRVNSSGVQLSKTDLLFSSIVAHWDEGRDNIETTIKTLNSKGNRFSFNNDFVMRSCLVLSDLPILFKVNSFKQENIERIKTNWPEIRKALETMVDLLVEWGFCDETLPTLNAVIPIAYFIFKGGKIEIGKNALRQYLVRALVNQIFASKTDRVLGALREHLRVAQGEGESKTFVLRNSQFVLSEMLSIKLPEDRTLVVNDDDIEELLAESKGPYTFMILSLLYPHLRFDQIQFHQDHMHPWSQFTTTKLDNLGLSENKIKQWQQDRDRLPNLQLMEGAANKSKNDMPFEKWIQALGSEQDYFMKRNYMPDEIGLGLMDFEAFYAARKELLRAKLNEVLKN